MKTYSALISPYGFVLAKTPRYKTAPVFYCHLEADEPVEWKIGKISNKRIHLEKCYDMRNNYTIFPYYQD